MLVALLLLPPALEVLLTDLKIDCTKGKQHDLLIASPLTPHPKKTPLPPKNPLFFSFF